VKETLVAEPNGVLSFADLRDGEGAVESGFLAPDFAGARGLRYYWAAETQAGSDGDINSCPLIWTSLDGDSYILRRNGKIEVTRPEFLKVEIDRLSSNGTLRGIQSALTDQNGFIEFRSRFGGDREAETRERGH
jgi:hypothetical protein